MDDQKNGVTVRKGFVLAVVFLFVGLFLPVQSQSPNVEYVVVKAAWHLHTSYSGGALSPRQLVQAYYDAGYNCISINDYNSVTGSFKGVAEAQQEGQELNMTIVAGQEIINQFPLQNGLVVWKHITALFLTGPVAHLYSCYRNNVVKPVFDQIHLQGGLGIVAHSWCLNDLKECGTTKSPWWNFRNASYVDGWEVFNWGTGMDEDSIYNVLGRGKIPLVSHDYHDQGAVSTQKYNVLFCTENTMAGVKDALVNQRMIAYYYGRVYGSLEALRLYKRYC